MVLWVEWEPNHVGCKEKENKTIFFFLTMTIRYELDLELDALSRQTGNLLTLNRDSDSAQIAPRFAVDQSATLIDVFLPRMLRTCTLFGDLSFVHWVNPGSLFEVVLDERYQVHST